jgi:hypothetical protein
MEADDKLFSLTTDQARAVAARRQQIAGVCAVCGATFYGLKRRLYCSHACAQRAFYARQRNKPDTPHADEP